MPVITINSVGLSYRDLGSHENRTIVFAHPMLFGSDVFDYLVSELVNDFHLILPDIHGHGQSGYRTPLTLDEMTAGLLSTTDRAQSDKGHLDRSFYRRDDRHASCARAS
jgi:pimeloyl-ACP methyl ester carboxylesterase